MSKEKFKWDSSDTRIIIFFIVSYCVLFSVGKTPFFWFITGAVAGLITIYKAKKSK